MNVTELWNAVKEVAKPVWDRGTCVEHRAVRIATCRQVADECGRPVNMSISVDDGGFSDRLITLTNPAELGIGRVNAGTWLVFSPEGTVLEFVKSASMSRFCNIDPKTVDVPIDLTVRVTLSADGDTATIKRATGEELTGLETDRLMRAVYVVHGEYASKQVDEFLASLEK